MRIMVLADGDTYTYAEGCVLLDIFDDCVPDELSLRVVVNRVRRGLDPGQVVSDVGSMHDVDVIARF
jgi:hypothetical protein